MASSDYYYDDPVDPIEEERNRARYLRDSIKLVNHLPPIYKMLANKNDVPTVELTLPDLKLYRHQRDKSVVLIATAFYLYLVKVKFSSVLTTVGASVDTLFKNAEIKPYCRWGLHSLECVRDLDNPYNVIITLLDFPLNDAGEAIFVDTDDADEKLQMFEAYSKFDPFSGIADDLDDPEIRKENPELFPEDQYEYDDEGNLVERRDEKDDDAKSDDNDMNESGNNTRKQFAPWKHVLLTCDSPAQAEMVVQEVTNLTVSSVVLRQKWSRRRKVTRNNNNKNAMFDLLGGNNSNKDEYEYLDVLQAAEEDEENSDSEDEAALGNEMDDSALTTTARASNLSPEEQKKRKREMNRRRNKLAAEKNKAAESHNYLDFAKNQDNILSGNVVTADALRLASEMRKVSALMSAEGASDTKLLKEVMLSRIAAAEFQKTLIAQQNQNTPAPASPPPDPIQLLKQHVRDNERTMEQVFSLHYEKFLTFVEKTSQLSTKTVERVHRSHDAVGHSIKSCATSLKSSAVQVVESRQVLSRVSHVTNMLQQRVKVSRLLETAERCVTNHSSMGLAEVLHPLHDSVVNGGLPSSDTLACYIVTIRLPQLRQIANSFATNKLHSWLGSLRDCIFALGEDLWRKSVDYTSSSQSGARNDHNNSLKAQINRMSERVEHVKKKLVVVEPTKPGRPHSWKIEHSVVPVGVNDISALFSREGTASVVNNGSMTQTSALDNLLKSKQQQQQQQISDSNNDAGGHKRFSLAARLAGSNTTSGSSNSKTSSAIADILAGNNNNTSGHSSNPNGISQKEQHHQILNTFSSRPGEFRGASYGRTIRRLFKLCGNEQELLTTCMDTRRLHLSTLLQSIENSSEFTAKSFVTDCTKALGFLHCEELLVHEADIDFTMSHLLFVWNEVQHAIAKRARQIGKKNPPSCALLFRTLTQFKTAALGCLLIRLPECEVIDRARQEQRDSMESGMIQTITTTLSQLAAFDDLEPLKLNRVGEAIKKNVLQFSLHLSGDAMLPIRGNNSSTSNNNNITAQPVGGSSNNNNSNQTAFSRFQALRRTHHHDTAPPSSTQHKDPTASTTTTTSSRLSVLNQNQASNAASSIISNPEFAPFSSIVPAVGDLLLGFLNECFSLGYDSGIGGGCFGANSDEQQSIMSKSRVVDATTGLMTEILDGSIHREWIDNTSLQMVQAVLGQICGEFKMKLYQEHIPSKDLRHMAVLRNNVAAMRMIVSTLEQRYALLFHGSLNGVFEFGKPVFLTSAGNDLIKLQDDTEQKFTETFLDLIEEKLEPIGHLSKWEKLLDTCQEEAKGDLDAFNTRPGTNTLLSKIPAAAKKSFFHQTVTEVIVELTKFLFNGIWPEHMVCAQARSAVCCVADVIRDKFEVMLEKAEIRRAGDLLLCLPVISTVVQDSVEVMMNGLNRNPDIKWTLGKPKQQQGGNTNTSSSTTNNIPTTSASTAVPSSLSARLANTLKTGSSSDQTSSSAPSTSYNSTNSTQQQQQDLVTFPMEDLDSYFTKQGAILFQRAEEYKNVANKIGANLDFATARALKMTNFAFKNVEKLGKFATKNIIKGAGHVVSGAKEGMHFVEGVAGTVTDEVKNTFRELKEEADEAGDMDFKNVTKTFKKENKDDKKKKKNGKDGNGDENDD